LPQLKNYIEQGYYRKQRMSHSAAAHTSLGRCTLVYGLPGAGSDRPHGAAGSARARVRRRAAGSARARVWRGAGHRWLYWVPARDPERAFRKQNSESPLAQSILKSRADGGALMPASPWRRESVLCRIHRLHWRLGRGSHKLCGPRSAGRC